MQICYSFPFLLKSFFFAQVHNTWFTTTPNSFPENQSLIACWLIWNLDELGIGKSPEETGQGVRVLLVHKLARILEDKELVKKETDHSRLVGGRVNKQENLNTRLVLGAATRWVDLHTHLRTRIFKVYREVLTGFNQIFNPDGLNTTLLSSLHPPKGLELGDSGWKVHCKDRAGGEESPIAQSTCWSTCNHVFQMTSSNNA